MSEKEKNKDVEIKKFEEEVEEAIDELFVPLSGGSDKSSDEPVDDVDTINAKPAEDKSAGNAEPKAEKTDAGEDVQIPNLESSIEAAIDELFVDTTAKSGEEPKPVEEAQSEPLGKEDASAPEQRVETAVDEETSEESVASEEQLYADVVDSLKEKLLSLDWEISAANIRAMEKALSELPPEVTSNAKIVSIVRMMQGVLKYLATVRYSASPLSIQFLRDAMEALEKLMIAPVVEEEEGKKIIGELVNKFRRLKYEAKKYQKVKVRKEVAERKVEELDLPADVVPDVLAHVDEIKKNLETIVTYNRKIKVCINRVQNLLSRYERLQAVLERKPALAKVSNYFGETTKGMVQEVNGIVTYLRELNGIFEQNNKIIAIHREILEKKSVKKDSAEPSGEPAVKEGQTEDVSMGEPGKDTEETSPRAESEKAVPMDEQTLVIPTGEGSGEAQAAGEVSLEPVEEGVRSVAEDAVEPMVAKAAEEATESEEDIPDIPVPEGVQASEVMLEEEKREKVTGEPSEEPEEAEPPKVPASDDVEVSGAEEAPVDSESTFEPVYLVTLAGQVLAIPSRFVANVYSLPERKIGLINSKGYAFLKELKPFYKSVKSGLSGPLAQKSKSELKNLRADVVQLDLKSMNISGEIPERQKGIVLLSNGDQSVLLCTDETVSKRPTPVTNFEGNHMGGCLSGRVEIEGQFNVPVIDVEKLLSQQGS